MEQPSDGTLAARTEAKLRILLALRERRQPRTGIELKAGSMETIGAVLGDVVHHRAHIAAILSAEIVRDDLNFLDRVLIGEEDLRPGDGVIVVRLSVDLEIIRAAALSIRGEARAVGIGKVVHVGCDDSGHEQGRIIEPAIHWQCLELLAVEDCLALCRIRVQQLRGAGLDLNSLRGRSWSEWPSANGRGVARDHLNAVDPLDMPKPLASMVIV